MANNSKKYVSLDKLQKFLENLSNKFALITHRHSVNDIDGYTQITVDTALSPTSTNPVQNKVLNEEFDAIGDAMGALELSIDGKLNTSDYIVDSELTSSSTNPVQNKAVNDGINLVYETMFSITDNKSDINHTHTKEDVGLGNVDNTADAEKSVNYANTAGVANSVEWKNVSDKPFSAYVNGTVLLSTTNVEETDDGHGIGRGSTGRFAEAVVSGEEYKVVFDGTEYHCIAYTDPIMNDYIILGNFAVIEPITGETTRVDTGEPFLICYSIIYKYAGVYTATIDSHTVEITHIEEIVENINESCIPDTIARKTDLDALETVVSGKADASHNHDDKYDTKGSANTALDSAKSYADTAATNAANAVKNDLLNGAGTAYDTLKELGDLITDNTDAIDALEIVAAGKADTVHSHDDIYYTETEIDAKLSDKADASHLHTVSNITDLTVTADELNYMDGATSNIQTQLDQKANTVHIHPYGVCTSSATYTTKTVSVENFELVEGARVIIKFVNANEASSPKLNVNGTGAIPIMCYGTTSVGSNTETNGWEAGAIIAFTYDGTNWIRDYWYNTTYTNAKLGQGYGTCYTATSTAEKEVSMTGYEDKTGGIVSIKFTYSVDAGATLNINGKGALDIYYNSSSITDDVIKGGDVATFINNGSSYRLISVDRWHEDIMALQASESKVKQMETVANGNFSLLLAPSDINGTECRYTYYADGIYANPSLKRIYADISGISTGVRGVTAGNFLIGNGSNKMIEKTPSEVLSLIGGTQVQIITWEADD